MWPVWTASLDILHQRIDKSHRSLALYTLYPSLNIQSTHIPSSPLPPSTANTYNAVNTRKSHGQSHQPSGFVSERVESCGWEWALEVGGGLWEGESDNYGALFSTKECEIASGRWASG